MQTIFHSRNMRTASLLKQEVRMEIKGEGKMFYQCGLLNEVGGALSPQILFHSPATGEFKAGPKYLTLFGWILTGHL